MEKLTQAIWRDEKPPSYIIRTPCAINVKLIPQLEKLKPGSRIVSHNWDMKGVIPDQLVKVTVNDDKSDPRSDSVIMVTPDHYIFLWTTPLKKE